MVSRVMEDAELQYQGWELHRWGALAKNLPFCRLSSCSVPRSMFLLVSIWMPVVSCPQPGSLAWIIPMSRASTMEVEGQQCLHPSYLIEFANKAVVGERPHFPSVWHSSSSVLSSPTSHNQDSAAVGCFSEEATSCDLEFRWKAERLQHP